MKIAIRKIHLLAKVAKAMNESTMSVYEPLISNSVVLVNISSLVITNTKITLIRQAYGLSLSTFSFCLSYI